MNAKRWTETVARSALWGLAALTSAYAFLCYVPFSWKQFILPKIYPAWVDYFVRFHPFLFWIVLALSIWNLVRSTRGGAAAPRNRVYAALQFLLGIFLTWHPLAVVGNDNQALAWCLLSWEPLVFWEALLALERYRTVAWAPLAGPDQDSRRFKSVLLAALTLTAGYFGTYWYGQTAHAWAAGSVAFGWSLLSHALAFLSFFVLADAAQCTARLHPRQVLAESRLLLGLLGLGLYLFLGNLVLAAISFEGGSVALVAAACSLGTVAAVFGEALAVQSAREEAVEDALEFLTGPFRAMAGSAPAQLLQRVGCLVFLLLWPAVVHWAIGSQDWGGLFESLGAVTAWAAAFSLFYNWSHKIQSPQRFPFRPLGLTAGIVFLAWAAQAATGHSDHALSLRKVIVPAALARLSDGDASYRTVRRLFRKRDTGGSFYRFLQMNTNLSRKVPVTPMDVQLVDSFGPGVPAKPHLFVIAIDSLRQDYVGAYNPRVAFTPAIDAFAAESLVWKKAFTAYGATGLSQPSLWAGALLLHKQFVTPFHPMNSLEKLLAHERYQRLIAWEENLRAILEESPDDAPLDAKAAGPHLLCDTLQDLSARLPAAKASGRPLFAYALPQDIHVSVINRESRSNITGKGYPGFDAPYASRVERLDRCFGRFISELKRQGLFEKSVVVLTADHGDSLGEGGRWGHAYTIFPEILRVPLIMHVPKPLLEGRAWDLEAPASLIDITPTFYALLGQRPLNLDPLYGRSLVAASREVLEKSRKAEQMVASSYGPVYGLLKNGGRNLYIIDGVNYATYYFDLKKDPAGERNLVTPEVEAEGNAAIRKVVESLGKAYRFTP